MSVILKHQLWLGLLLFTFVVRALVMHGLVIPTLLRREKRRDL